MKQLVANITESWPEFSVKGLEPGDRYTATIVAFNSKGTANSSPLTLTTVEEAPVHKSEYYVRSNLQKYL